MGPYSNAGSTRSRAALSAAEATKMAADQNFIANLIEGFEDASGDGAKSQRGVA